MAYRPDLADVLAAAHDLIGESAADSRALTVATLAQRTGIVRSALYSLYPEAVELIRAARTSAGLTSKGRPRDERANEAEKRARRARRDADEAEALSATYAEVIRYLTEENIRLAREQNERADIPRIGRSAPTTVSDT